MFNLSKEKIRIKIQNRNLTICVFGLGKMGLPLAVAFADAGFKVVGVDINSQIVEKVNSGQTWFEEPELDEILAKVVGNGKLVATSDGAKAVQEGEFTICITPLALDQNRKPDLSSIRHVTRTISKNLQRGHVISFETTLPIGTTENVLKPILEESNLEAGKDFGLVYAPERLMSGRVFSRLRELKKIVGGLDEKSAFIAAQIYSAIHPSGTNLVRNPRTAEMVKLAAGVWRDVNIAFANEMAKIAEEYSIDITSVIEEVNTSPRRMMLRPGCGVGGHCIPVYPYFLINKVKSHIPLIEAARKTNESMPLYTVNLAEEELRRRSKELEGSRVVILGLAFRPYVKEIANSPTLDMVRELKKRGSVVFVFDPLFKKDEAERITGARSGDLEDILGAADCVIITTMYRMFRKINEKVDSSCVVIDGRNRLEEADKGIGRQYRSRFFN